MNDIKYVIGIDLSANAAGLVVLDYNTNTVIKAGFITTQQKYKSENNIEMYYLEPRRSKRKDREEEDKDNFIARRRHDVSNLIQAFILCAFDSNSMDPESTLVCLEDYAISSVSRGLLEMAEISGLVRNWLWKLRIPLRLHDPLSVKMWATNHGFASKIHMVNAAIKAGFAIPTDLLEKGSKFKDPIVVEENKVITHDYAGPGTDIADAFHLASLGIQELKIRNGIISFQDLPEHNRKVFLRVTKANPVNLLSCPFILSK